MLTLQRAVSGISLSRFGDGELKLCHGDDSLTQVYIPKLADELREILQGNTKCLVAIPHSNGERAEYWAGFMAKHSKYLKRGVTYGSAFISRPDEAPWIRSYDYKLLFQRLWRERDVVLVGSGSSLTSDKLEGARSIRRVDIPPEGAYADIKTIEKEIGTPSHVLLCAGATGTVLAHRLAEKGVHAVDAGFAGKFM